MAGRSMTYQKCQWGVEVTPGTGVSANKRPLNTYVRLRPVERVEPVRSVGSAAPTTSSKAQGSSEFDLEGAMGFGDLPYLLASLLGAPTGTYTFLPANFTPPTPKTLTIEAGDAGRAEKVVYAVVSALSFTFDETECSLTGSGFAQPLQEGVSLTGSPTNLPKIVLQPKDTIFKIGDSVGGLATLPKGTQGAFGISNMWGPNFYRNGDASFTEHQARTPELSASLQMDNDSTASDLLADLRAGTVKIVEIGNTGPEYSSGNNYSFRLRYPALLLEKAPGEREEEFVGDFTLQPCYDETFGGYMEIVVQNGTGGL